MFVFYSGRAAANWMIKLIILKCRWMEGKETELRTSEFISFKELEAWNALADSFEWRLRRDAYLENARKNPPYHITGV